MLLTSGARLYLWCSLNSVYLVVLWRAYTLRVQRMFTICSSSVGCDKEVCRGLFTEVCYVCFHFINAYHNALIKKHAIIHTKKHWAIFLLIKQRYVFLPLCALVSAKRLWLIIPKVYPTFTKRFN